MNFRTGSLASKRVDAWRDNASMRDKSGAIPVPTAGYALLSAVVVELADPAVVPAALTLAAQQAGARVTTDPGIPGFLVVDSAAATWTVQNAIAFAHSARRMPGVAGAFVDMQSPLEPRITPTDPLFPNQWHLRNTASPLFDVNAEPAWDAGFTGANIVVGIIDQGWAISHPDLAAAYDSTASQPGATFDSHGTGCAGIVGARAFNEGLVGVAYDSRMAKLYYGPSTTNAAAFAFRNDLNHIKNNSWGPSDNGMISYLPANERTAIATAIETGRSGLGEIFVWSAGNGAQRSDRVDYDPYASSRYTIAVGAIDNADHRSIYSETGSSLLVCAQSDRDLNTTADAGIWTTSAPSNYTGTFGGTSAAAPLASGVVALMLQARPELTWRDVQHVLVHSARQCDPTHAGWTINGAGLPINYEYGFGAVDAGAATALSRTWRVVEPAQTLSSGVLNAAVAIPNNDPNGVFQGFEFEADLLIEHVEVMLNVTHPFVGDLRITLYSPGGVESVFAVPRGDATDNYTNYVFTSVRHWNEHCQGVWKLRIADERLNDVGTWVNWSISIHGTTPWCFADYNRDGILNSQDYFDFLNAFFVDNADINLDGVTNSQDFFMFCHAFFSGC